MIIANAIKKLERAGWVVTHSESRYTARKPGFNQEISFLPNGADEPDRSAVCLRVRSLNDHDDMQSDYTAGSYFDSLASAIRSAER